MLPAGFHLLAEDGGELIGTLLPMPPALWDRPRRRLTVLLEPGRIKRGLQPNVQAGPPLVPGTSVTFVVDGQLTDAAGALLVSGAERTYRIDKPIRSRVDPAGWEVRWPDSAGGQLVVRFGPSLDRALVRRCLRVVGPDGRVVPGQAILDRDAEIWTFTPAVASVAGWSLHVHPDLEDVAGNSVRRPFDRDLWDGKLVAGPLCRSCSRQTGSGAASSPIDITKGEVVVVGQSSHRKSGSSAVGWGSLCGTDASA